MAKKIAIGIQDFGDLIRKKCFYVDKTDFIREWWESNDSVTLITRPRRFGKTLNLSMTEQFFSLDYAGQGELFRGLSVWKEEEYRKLQGTYPVISLSFANVKEKTYPGTKEKICQLLTNLYVKYSFLMESDVLAEADRAFFGRMMSPVDMRDTDATLSLYQLSDYLYRYYGRKVIILLDEYDTPMQEAYVDGYWDELVSFTRSLFNAAFKTNPWLERGLMTGITRVSKESVFSDLNNLKVVTTTSDEYAVSFGFTQQEVSDALAEWGLSCEGERVKQWYDGFTFGTHKDIYNPWSILNFLDTGKYAAYWANTSSNSLADKLIREGTRGLKERFERLMRGEAVRMPLDEQIVYDQLNGNERAVWSLFLAGGYLKVLSFERYNDISEGEQPQYELVLTNLEVKIMFQNMVQGWFAKAETDYNDFIKAMLLDDVDAMNDYMNRVALSTFSYFDTGRNPLGEEPERFYHGFVLGLMVQLGDRYLITSNRESGFGRYDVMLEPKTPGGDDALILEFKVFNKRREKSLEDTAAAALRQIEEKQYAAQLRARGIEKDHIRCYGFAFQGKRVLIEKACCGTKAKQEKKEGMR